MPADPRTSRLAVLIDADNIPARHIEAVLDEIAGLGEPSVRRVYGDWSSQALTQWKEKARSLGLVMHQQSANTKGKNASDIGLVIDAMDILHAGKVDGFVLVSSDSDFTRLAARIREEGVDVYGFGEQKTPESFRQACTRFIYTEDLPVPASATSDDAAPPPLPPARRKPSIAAPMIAAAIADLDEDGDGWVHIGPIGTRLRNTYPDFSQRTYGYAKLSDLIRATGRFEVDSKGPGGMRIRDRA